MAYVLEVISKDGKIKYINSAKATVYCPEYAARYDDKKTAMTVAAALAFLNSSSRITISLFLKPAITSTSTPSLNNCFAEG